MDAARKTELHTKLLKAKVYRSLGLFMHKYSKGPANLVAMRKVATREKANLSRKEDLWALVPPRIQLFLGNACSLKRL